MWKINTYKSLVIYLAIGAFLMACNDPQSPGYEYMPDMYRSPAIEEYVDYGEIRDQINSELANQLSARKPIEGTIPFTESDEKVKFNFPYPYTLKEYDKAGEELVNPIQFNEEIYLKGKDIYTIYCVHCHGAKGDGVGSMVESGAFPQPPAYQTIVGLNQGKMFHTLQYGKGNMGSHASQLNKEERWTVVHYVQTLKDGQFDNPFANKTEQNANDANQKDS